MKKIIVTLSILIAAALTNQLALAQNNLSKKAIYPSSILGKYMVYKSGAVTSFRQKKHWMKTYIEEFYVYSRKPKAGVVARAKYKNNHLILSDKMRGQQYRDLLAKDRIYKRCRNDIFNPPVEFYLAPVKDIKTGMFYTDRWDVKQNSLVCNIVNTEHHSRGNYCETKCVKYEDCFNNPGLSNMRLFSSKSAAIANSKAR